MGRVWRAMDVVLHRDVAIKELVPPPGLTSEERQEMRERSLREARAIARLNNINVVRVFDVLRTDADPWIVMEYVPSRSLQDRLAADGPFPPLRAAEIGLGVLNALRAAHRNGVVHRDVKPGNVLIGEDGRVVLTDFGLATVPGDPNVTRTGLVLGSPAYIAPERARDGTAGPAADMWSLGATLYAAVEGASPFARSSAIATLAALATENPPPARNAGPLKPVLNGLLRKDPSHRINADEAERLLLRATGRKSKLTFPMSPTMRRPGVGRERPAYQAGPPVIPGMPTAAGSAPVVPGPRPPVTSGPPLAPGRTSGEGRVPVTPGRTSGEDRPPVTPGRTSGEGRAPVTPGLPSDEGRPPVFTPGKASVGRPPGPAETRLDMPAVREDQDLAGTGYSAPTSPPENSALAKSAPGTYGTITPGTAAARSVGQNRTPEREQAERDASAREAANRAAKESAAAEQRAAAERQAAAQKEAAEREAADRKAEREAAAQREAAEREAAAREAAEREAARREAERQREAAERAAADKAAADKAAADKAAAQRAAAERATAEREAAEQAAREAEQREAAERAATAEQPPSERELKTRPGAIADTAQTPAAGGPLTGADADETTTPGTTDRPAEESSADAADKAVNKPVVGARAGVHSSKAARKKGRGRTGPGASRAQSTRTAANTNATAPTNDVDTDHPATAAAPHTAAAAPDTAPAANTDATTPVDAATIDASAAAVATDDQTQTGTNTASPGDPQPEAEAEKEPGAPEQVREEATVVPLRTETQGTDRSAGTKSKPKVAAARTGERKVTTATLPARTSTDAVNVPLSPGTTTARESIDAAAFTVSSRPAWHPMPVIPPKSNRGMTVLGTTLTRRQTAIGGAILLALLLVLAVLVPKAVSDDKQSGRTTGGAPVASAPAKSATTATTTTTPSQRPTTTTPPSTAPATSGAVALPAGWYLYHDKTGFSVPAPKGWSIRRQGTEVYFEERRGQYRLMIVDQTDKPQPDPVKDWQTKEADRISRYRNYHRISIHAVSYWDKAADWEYTRTSDNGNPLHVVKRGFITAKDQAYGITWSTSAGDWNANKSNLALIYKGFIPAKS